MYGKVIVYMLNVAANNDTTSLSPTDVYMLPVRLWIRNKHHCPTYCVPASILKIVYVDGQVTVYQCLRWQWYTLTVRSLYTSVYVDSRIHWRWGHCIPLIFASWEWIYADITRCIHWHCSAFSFQLYVPIWQWLYPVINQCIHVFIAVDNHQTSNDPHRCIRASLYLAESVLRLWFLLLDRCHMAACQ